MPSLATRLRAQLNSSSNRSTPSAPGAPSLQPYVTGAAPSRAALAALLTPVRWARTWSAIRQTIEAGAAGAVGGTFELVRYDFVLDAAAAPWLLEVNSWPNMVPSSPGQAAQLHRLCSFLRSRAAATTAAATATATA